METTNYAQRMIQNALYTSAEYWQERGDDNFLDQYVTTRDRCYELAQEYRHLYEQHVAKYGTYAGIPYPIGDERN